MPLSDVLAYTYAKAPGAATGKSDDEVIKLRPRRESRSPRCPARFLAGRAHRRGHVCHGVTSSTELMLTLNRHSGILKPPNRCVLWRVGACGIDGLRGFVSH